jgi:predicted TPR repeat methyltransferase
LRSDLANSHLAASDKQRRSDLVEVRDVVDYFGILEKLVDGSRKVLVANWLHPKSNVGAIS